MDDCVSCEGRMSHQSVWPASGGEAKESSAIQASILWGDERIIGHSSRHLLGRRENHRPFKPTSFGETRESSSRQVDICYRDDCFGYSESRHLDADEEHRGSWAGSRAVIRCHCECQQFLLFILQSRDNRCQSKKNLPCGGKEYILIRGYFLKLRTWRLL